MEVISYKVSRALIDLVFGIGLICLVSFGKFILSEWKSKKAYRIMNRKIVKANGDVSLEYEAIIDLVSKYPSRYTLLLRKRFKDYLKFKSDEHFYIHIWNLIDEWEAYSEIIEMDKYLQKKKYY